MATRATNDLLGSAWVPATERLPEVCVSVIGYADRWVDPDFNESGMRDCFRGDDEWTSAAWNNYQDCWDSEPGAPDYWMPWPPAPMPNGWKTVKPLSCSDAPEKEPEGRVQPLVRCRRCNGKMRPSQALLQTWIGHPDFPGDTGNEVGCTQTVGGVGKLISVLKCEDCGHSISAPNGRTQV